MRQGIKLVPIAKLRAHEQVCPQRLASVMRSIKNKRMIVNPIIFDKKTGIILDGHHRTECLRLMHCRLVPAMAVDYLSDQVCLFSRRENIKVNKAVVLSRGLSGRPFPYKTTRNWIRGRIRGINLSLDKLK